MDDISNFELHDQATLKLLPRGRGMVPSGPKEPLLFRPLYLAPLGTSIPVIRRCPQVRFAINTSSRNLQNLAAPFFRCRRRKPAS